MPTDQQQLLIPSQQRPRLSWGTDRLIIQPPQREFETMPKQLKKTLLSLTHSEIPVQEQTNDGALFWLIFPSPSASLHLQITCGISPLQTHPPKSERKTQSFPIPYRSNGAFFPILFWDSSKQFIQETCQGQKKKIWSFAHMLQFSSWATQLCVCLCVRVRTTVTRLWAFMCFFHPYSPFRGNSARVVLLPLHKR